MLTASKCMINNDYALEIMQGMEYYPYYSEENEEDYPTIKLNRDPATNKMEVLLKDKKIKLNRYDNVWRTSFKKIKIDKIYIHGLQIIEKIVHQLRYYLNQRTQISL